MRRRVLQTLFRGYRLRRADTVQDAHPNLRDHEVARTRTALIGAAGELCLREGYEQATIERIAEAADISPRTFARYFGGKEAVL
jgi:AcrR family transcriptional regulator